MHKVQQKASLSERAVQKVAAENITMTKPRARSARKATTRVKKQHWTDGVDPGVVQAIHQMKIPQVWKRIQVISSTEVVIHNQPVVGR